MARINYQGQLGVAPADPNTTTPAQVNIFVVIVEKSDRLRDITREISKLNPNPQHLAKRPPGWLA